jgi:hypothetical protein
MNLEGIAVSMLEQFPTAQRSNLQRQERMLERFGQIAFGGFGVVVLAAIGGIIYWIVSQMLLDKVGFWSGILLIAFILFAGLTLTYVVLNESLKEKRAKLGIRAAAPDALDRGVETGKLLNETSMPGVPSVIEDTTELLPVHNLTKKL